MQIIIVLLYVWAIFAYGLYFPDHIYPFVLTVSLLSAAVMVYELIRGRKPDFLLWLLPLPLLYLLPLIFGTYETVQGTFNQMAVMSLTVMLSFLLLKLKKEEDGTRRLHQVIILISWTVFGVSWAVLAGLFSFPEFVLTVAGKGNQVLGDRLAGPFQYPNAFASLLGSILLYVLADSVRSKAGARFFMQAALLPGVFGLFLLTESRGAWLLFGAVYLLGLRFGTDKGKRLAFLVLSLYAGLGGVILYAAASGSMQASLFTVVLLIVLSGAAYFLKTAIDRLPQSASLEKWLPAAMAAVTASVLLDLWFKGLGFRLLPVSLKERLSFGTGTLTDRFYYWTDVWEHAGLAGLFGRGGEAWSFLMYRIQSYPYLTSEIHSSIVNQFIETGTAGLLLVAGIILAGLRNLWKERSAVWPAWLFLLLHSCLDFSFSYPSILAWLLLLYMAGAENPDKKENKNRRLQYIPAGILAVLLLASALLSIRYIQAEQSFRAGMQSGAEEEAAAYLMKAAEILPWQTRYTSTIAEQGLAAPRETEVLLKQAIHSEPANARLHFQLAELYREMDLPEKAEAEYTASLAYDLYDIEKYSRITEYYTEKAENARQKGEGSVSSQAMSDAGRVCRQAKKLVQETEGNAMTNQRDFHLTDGMIRICGGKEDK